MDKRRLHHLWTKFRFIRPRYILIFALVMTLIFISALRHNNEHMIKLRDAVYSADKNNSDVETPLRKLQVYVTTHMNTNLSAGPNAVYPPIQLKYTYDRLVQAQSGSLAGSNTQIYNDAQHYCEGQNSSDFSGRNRVPCIEQYVQSHNPSAAPTIPDALYKFDFVTPKWSPDLAGWSLVLAVLSGILFVTSYAADRWLRKNT